MPAAKTALLILLGVIGVLFCAVWAGELTRRRGWRVPTPFQGLVGFISDFLDTLGIGSYATTTALYRLRGVVPDEKIPGTLNVGHTLPTIAQALIYITILEIEMMTLVLLIGAAVLGAWLGAGVVTRLPRHRIQVGMGIALLVATGFILGRLLDLFPEGGHALGLDGVLLAAGLAGNFVFGALMTIGIGAYAPIMIMVSLLGMNQKAAFPIMMGSCAFLMPVASVRFIRTEAYDARAALGLALAGVPAVLLAAFIVKDLPLDVVRWLVVVVVVYTATTMLRAAYVERRQALARGQAPATPDLPPQVTGGPAGR
ncbi:MAG: sulfite exporter TauE/SafE family protein [Gemmataceae bacterium]|nr:sulfite exporter TauE/SafE family protein [Gemmataceae bacterium]